MYEARHHRKKRDSNTIQMGVVGNAHSAKSMPISCLVSCAENLNHLLRKFNFQEVCWILSLMMNVQNQHHGFHPHLSIILSIN